MSDSIRTLIHYLSQQRPHFKVWTLLRRCVFFSFSLLSLGTSLTLPLEGGTEQASKEQPQDKLKVLSTVGVIHDLVQSIGGDAVQASVLIAPQLDPHSYELVKGDDHKFDQAQIVFAVGLGLEHGASLQRRLLRNTSVVLLGNDLMQSYPCIEVDGVTDPHIWMDLSIWAGAVDIIVEHLGQWLPQYRSLFEHNGLKLKERILELDSLIQVWFEEIPQERRFLITTHDAFNYFVRRYLATEEERHHGIWTRRSAAPEGLAPEGQINSEDIRRIAEYAIEHEIHILFAESNLSQKSLKQIVRSVSFRGGTLLIAKKKIHGDTLCDAPPGEAYLLTMHSNAQIISSHLKGEYDT